MDRAPQNRSPPRAILASTNKGRLLGRCSHKQSRRGGPHGHEACRRRRNDRHRLGAPDGTTARLGGELVADFDGFTEGELAATIEDGGIVFSDIDVRIPGYPVPGVFAIDGAGGLLGPEHSPPNVANTNGYQPGPGVGYSRVGSTSITFSSMLANAASIDVFSLNVPSNELTLQA